MEHESKDGTVARCALQRAGGSGQGARSLHGSMEVSQQIFLKDEYPIQIGHHTKTVIIIQVVRLKEPSEL